MTEGKQMMGRAVAVAVLAVAILGRAEVLPAQEGDPRPEPGDPPRAAAEVDVEAQLMITDLEVVEDARRTRTGRRPGVWTFQYLIENMAGRRDPAEFALRWLELWEEDQIVNGQVSPARPSIRDQVIEPWLAASGGERLDLSRAPFKLLAIVNRMDLRQHDGDNVSTAGEGRFIFGVLGPDGEPLPPLAGSAAGGFTVIFEYELIAKRMRDLRRWARLWDRLGDFEPGSRRYNRHLQRITRRFTDRGRGRGKPNRSALNQIRTNELALGSPWEMREFVIDAESGWLSQHTVALTPGTVENNGTAALAGLINAHESEILGGTFDLPERWFGASSLVGPFRESDFPFFADRSFTVLPFFEDIFNIPWSAAGIRNNDARHLFALNTCNGCHRDETGTGFLQVGFPEEHRLPESLGTPAALAGFLTGTEVEDPVDPSTIRSFADLQRRKLDLEELLDSFAPNGRGAGPRDRRHAPRFVH